MAAGARADVFDDAQAALERAAAQTGGAPPPVAPAPAKKVELPKKSAETGGVPAPSAVDPTPVDPTPSNVNISIRVQSPGNDGPVVQQDHVSTSADLDRLERDLNVKFKKLEKQISKAQPKIAMPVIRHVAAKPPPAAPKPTRKPKAHYAAKPAPVHSAPPAKPAVTERAVHRSHKVAPPTHHKTPFQLPQPSDNQAMSAGSSGGTSTPPPAPIAALLAAACLAASMLVTTLWDAHRRRRSRLFASRLERPG
jgi:hypothetical protein